MRRKVLKISSEMFNVFFCPGSHEGYEVVRDGVPKDAVIIQVQMERFAVAGCARVDVLLESKEFGYVQDGQPWPELNPIIQKTVDNAR